MRISQRVASRLLRAIIVSYLLLGLLYSVSTPVLEAPDEVWHYSYIHYLALEHRFPPWSPTSPAKQESSQPPLYYAAATVAVAWTDLTGPPEFLARNHHYGHPSAGTVPDNKNVFLHSRAEAFPWQGQVLAVHVARWVNVLFGCLTVIATYLLAQEVFGTRFDLIASATAVVAFNPQFLFISAAVNNDAALAAFSTLALWMLARGTRLGYTTRRLLLLGCFIGLASLSKVSGLALLLVVPVALVASQVKSRRWNEVWRAGILVAISAGIVAGWWYARNTIVYRDPLGVTTHFNTWWAHEEPLSPRELLSQLPGVELSFWAAFGMGNVHLPNPFYIMFRIVTRLAVMGVLLWVLRSWHQGHRPGMRAFCVAVLGLWTLLVFVALLRWMQLVEAALGRLLFPAIGSIAILLVLGLCELAPRQLGSSVSLVFSLALLATAVASPFIAITPAYAPPPLLAIEEMASFSHQDDVYFGDSIRLVGHSMNRHEVQQGHKVVVTLCWEALTPLSRDYAYFVHLLGPDELIVGGRDTYPGLGRYPTRQWRPGDAFCDEVHVRVEEWAPAPAVYNVEVGWYDPETGERLPAYGVDGSPLSLVLIERVEIVSTAIAGPLITHRLDASLAGQIVLLGYDLDPAPISPGQVMSVTLYWAARDPIPTDYTVFVHLGFPDRPPLAQDDSQPRHGTYPTTCWDIGQVVADHHLLPVPVEILPGAYEILTGMYLLGTGERLPAFDADGVRFPNDAIPLAEVEVVR